MKPTQERISPTQSHRLMSRERKVMDTTSKCDHEKKQEITVTRDVPQDILVLIHNKLHDLADRVRFRAVCKNWRVPKEFINRFDSCSWVTNYSWFNSTLTCELFRPHSQKVYKTSNTSLEKSNPLDFITNPIIVYATKHWWSLVGGGRSLFLHNPFVNEIILLPKLDFDCQAATFTVTPSSPDCEVFLFWMRRRRSGSNELHIRKYCLSTSDRKLYWSSSKCLGMRSNLLLSVEYLKGSIYCLFDEWVLKRYNLADKSWESLTTDSPKDYNYSSVLSAFWLVKKGGDLVVVCTDYTKNWRIFRFDFCEMRWVDVETNLKGWVFFISGKIAFSMPFADCDGKEIKDCILFYIDYKRDELGIINRYRFNSFCWKKKKRYESNYRWIEDRPFPNFSLIHPPHI